MNITRKKLFNKIKSIPIEHLQEDGKNHCSCSPDVIKSVRISRACKRHDTLYSLLADWRSKGSINYLQFIFYRFQADHQLRYDIIRLGELQNVDLSLEANIYCDAVHWLNPVFRLICKIWNSAGRNKYE